MSKSGKNMQKEVCSLNLEEAFDNTNRENDIREIAHKQASKSQDSESETPLPLGKLNFSN